jgi:hypothetical protein
VREVLCVNLFMGVSGSARVECLLGYVFFDYLMIGLFFCYCDLQRRSHETMKMKAGEILLFLLCLNVIFFEVVKNFFVFSIRAFM